MNRTATWQAVDPGGPAYPCSDPDCESAAVYMTRVLVPSEDDLMAITSCGDHITGMALAAYAVQKESCPTTNTVINWRDFTGLTTEQTAAMEEHERMFLGHHPQADAILVEQAEYMAACNRIDADYAHVAVPVGAHADRWVRENGEWSRSLEWAQVPTTVAAVDLYIDGRQKLDGSHTSQVSLYSDGTHLSGEQARALAAALVQAADDLDLLDGGAR